ncbi:DUF6114 domain-containing protein [Streptomyces iconiensis]|uniref:DUF6114 domain-containing protein n=1 Tax=Streptomyces iconiensis TaxID=1384038 RepID=A0ABT6ZZN9_9ACTN|nr:DUF6114 domain-containing protein [Streptomyces iconiensis]MDJ1134259.1 DUF6114 domain-containing protein [Streptomyces iconiensis]
MRLTARPRPVAACLCVALAGLELGALPLARPSMLGIQGLSAATALLLAAALVGCAVHLWARPARALWAGTGAILLGLLSYPLANLGGFLLGILLALTGGALALAWRTTEDTPPTGRG